MTAAGPSGFPAPTQKGVLTVGQDSALPEWTTWENGTLAVDARGRVRLVERTTNQHGEETVWLMLFSDEYADTHNERYGLSYSSGNDAAEVEPVRKLECPHCGHAVRGKS